MGRAASSGSIHEPHALALADYFERGIDAEYRMECEDGAIYRYRASRYFAVGARQAALHAQAIARCRGIVWDIGAGVGRHSLVLQERGHEVLAIDSSPLCVALMQRRGVRHTLCLDAFDLADGRAETLLFLDHNLGLAGTARRLGVLFERLKARLAPGGQILADGGDGPDGADVRLERSVGAQLVYGEYTGPRFEWLYIGSVALSAVAHQAGYACDVVHRDPSGRYLARLTAGGA